MPHKLSTALVEEPSTQSGVQPSIRRSNEASTCRVLVVDDDNLIRARLCALLRYANYDVACAASGEEALRVIDTNPPHIVLTDWQMPDLDGIELCRRLRNGGQHGYFYLMMFTIRATPLDVLAGMAAGVDDFIVKGASADELLARVEVGRRMARGTQPPRNDDERWRLALADPTSGAHNLRYIAERLPCEVARSRRYGHPLTVLSCRIDGFGLIKEPAVRDEVVRAFVADSVCCLRRDIDWLARVEREEFLIVLPETTAAGGDCVARKVRQRFALRPVTIDVTAVEPKRALDSMDNIDNLLQIERLLRATDGWVLQ